jgi:hypothetical protein
VEKDKRLKEKIAVPVVEAGKVEIQPNCLQGIDLGHRQVF